MDKLTRINGNGQEYTQDLPAIEILAKEINDIALNHILENTGLKFIYEGFSYRAQPVQAWQIVNLLLTYNFKTQYNDNATFKNTLMLKFANHIVFDVSSICFDCAKYNNLHTDGLSFGDRLAC